MAVQIIPIYPTRSDIRVERFDRRGLVSLEGEGMLKIKYVRVNKLKTWKDNPRRNDRAIKALSDSIRSFGFNVPILCDQGMQIVAGHARLKAAVKLGMKSVPVIVVQMTDTERRSFAIAENKTSEIADWDTPKLRGILEELHSEDIDIRSLGFSSKEVRALLRHEREEEDACPKVPTKTSTVNGTLFTLGQHRLLCGDSRFKKTFKRLLGNEKVDHVFAGPPCFHQRKFCHWTSYEQHLRDMLRIGKNCYDAMADGAVVVWHVGNGCAARKAHTVHHARTLEKAGFLFLDMLIWKKNSANYGVHRNTHIKQNRYYYPAFQWEALHVYQKKGKMPQMTPDAAQYMLNYQTR